MDYDNGYDYDEEHFLPEVDIFNRVAFDNGDTLEAIAINAGIRPENRKKGDRFMNKIWRFYVYVNAAARRFIDEEIVVNVKIKEIPNILRKIQLVDNPQYKNPDAFFCGYAVSKHGQIDKKVLNHIVASSENIKATDIFRYGRLWLKLLKSK